MNKDILITSAAVAFTLTTLVAYAAATARTYNMPLIADVAALTGLGASMIWVWRAEIRQGLDRWLGGETESAG